MGHGGHGGPWWAMEAMVGHGGHGRPWRPSGVMHGPHYFSKSGIVNNKDEFFRIFTKIDNFEIKMLKKLNKNGHRVNPALFT